VLSALLAPVGEATVCFADILTTLGVLLLFIFCFEFLLGVLDELALLAVAALPADLGRVELASFVLLDSEYDGEGADPQIFNHFVDPDFDLDAQLGVEGQFDVGNQVSAVN